MKKNKITRTLNFRLKEMMLAYPSIFPNEDHAINHLYLVIGNGYEWEKGVLEYKCDDEKSAVRNMLLEGVPEDMIKAWVKKQDDKRHRDMFNDDPNLKALLKKYDIKESYDLEPRSVEPVHPYPICEYSAIYDIPADAKPDWVTGAYRAAVLALTYDSFDSKNTRSNRKWVAKSVARLDKLFGTSNRPSRK